MSNYSHLKSLLCVQKQKSDPYGDTLQGRITYKLLFDELDKGTPSEFQLGRGHQLSSIIFIYRTELQVIMFSERFLMLGLIRSV